MTEMQSGLPHPSIIYTNSPKLTIPDEILRRSYISPIDYFVEYRHVSCFKKTIKRRTEIGLLVKAHKDSDSVDLQEN